MLTKYWQAYKVSYCCPLIIRQCLKHPILGTELVTFNVNVERTSPRATRRPVTTLRQKRHLPHHIFDKNCQRNLKNVIYIFYNIQR